MMLSLQQPRSFHQGLSIGEIGQKGTKFKLKREDGTKEGSLELLGKVTPPKAPKEGMPKV